MQRPSRLVSEKLNSNHVVITKMKTFSKDRVNQFGFLKCLVSAILN